LGYNKAELYYIPIIFLLSKLNRDIPASFVTIKNAAFEQENSSFIQFLYAGQVCPWNELFFVPVKKD